MDEYEKLNQIGTGRLGTKVYLYQHKHTGEKFAAKVVKTNSLKLKQVMASFLNLNLVSNQ